MTMFEVYVQCYAERFALTEWQIRQIVRDSLPLEDIDTFFVELSAEQQLEAFKLVRAKIEWFQSFAASQPTEH